VVSRGFVRETYPGTKIARLGNSLFGGQGRRARATAQRRRRKRLGDLVGGSHPPQRVTGP
jgi:hypothetical protein